MSSRTRLSLDGEWCFSPTEILSAENCPRITVPSPWQADERFRAHIGTAWYQCEVDIPSAWMDAGRSIILGFGAVDYFAEVWLNGERIGAHEGGYLPFELDITAAARDGVNTLTVRVDDPLEIFPEIPHGKQSWYGLLSGIWQPVWVESRSISHIQRVKISTFKEHVELSVFTSIRPENGLMEAEILAPDGRPVAHTTSTMSSFTIRIDHPHPWSPDEPNLYTLKISLSGIRLASSKQSREDRDVLAVSEVLDEITETFGFRTIETKEGQILLNGRPFYLRGALDQDYYPERISTPPSQEYIEDQFRKAKEMGLNCMRIHIKVADPRYYAAADKVGLLIWTELPNHSLLTDEARRRARETLSGMVERDGNHPSIGIWTIVNESWGIDLTDPTQRAWLAETYQWLKSLDPTRLVVGNSACWGNYHVATDIADFHIYYAMPDHYNQWRDWTAQYTQRPWWLFAHEYQDHAAWREYLRDPLHAEERSIASDVQQKGDEPLLISEFGNWGLPDIKKLYEGNGGSAPWWFDTGLEWGEGVVYPRGIEQRFKNFHFDRVFPSLSALAEASQRLQYEALKFQIENIRSHASIQGYVITEFTDLHWECNGLLDMFRNPKQHFPLLKQFNADDILIPIWERLVFTAGEACAIKILFSHYSAREIKGAELQWKVEGDHTPLDEGSSPVGECPSYSVTDLGIASFDAPEVQWPTRVQVKFNLYQEKDLIASMEQDVYIFPTVLAGASRGQCVFAPDVQPNIKHLGYQVTDSMSRADLAVVTTLDDSCREFILRGGRVLFLAEHDETLQTHIPGLGIQPRQGTPWQGDWASSFGWHHFRDLPTSGIVNFAFAGLTPEHIIHGFSARDFAFDVYAGLSVGWLHKPVATIARRRAGRGEVLAATFRLSQNLETNPLAMHLFAELMRLLENQQS